MKKMIAVMLTLLILTCSLVSCDRDAEPPESDGEMQTGGNTEDEGASEESSTGSESGEDKKEPEKGTGGSDHMLNGKKVIFEIFFADVNSGIRDGNVGFIDCVFQSFG